MALNVHAKCELRPAGFSHLQLRNLRRGSSDAESGGSSNFEVLYYLQS